MKGLLDRYRQNRWGKKEKKRVAFFMPSQPDGYIRGSKNKIKRGWWGGVGGGEFGCLISAGINSNNEQYGKRPHKTTSVLYLNVVDGHVIVMPTLFQALDTKTTLLNQK